MWLLIVLGVAVVLLGLRWWGRPHHHRTSGMRLRDSPFNSAAADYLADNQTPDVHPYGDYDGD
jgi:hypothetical protein